MGQEDDSVFRRLFRNVLDSRGLDPDSDVVDARLSGLETSFVFSNFGRPVSPSVKWKLVKGEFDRVVRETKFSQTGEVATDDLTYAFDLGKQVHTNTQIELVTKFIGDNGQDNASVKQYRDLLKIRHCGIVLLKFQGVSLFDLLRKVDQKKVDGSHYRTLLDFLSAGANLGRVAKKENLNNPLWKQFPNLLDEELGKLGDLFLAISKVDPGLLAQKKKGTSDRLESEIWGRASNAAENLQSLRQNIKEKLLKPYKNADSSVRPEIHSALRNWKSNGKDEDSLARIFWCAGIETENDLIALYRLSRKLRSGPQEGEFYELLCEAIPSYLDGLPTVTNVVTLADLQDVTKEDEEQSGQFQASWQELRAAAIKLHSGKNDRKFAIEGVELESLDLGLFLSPKRVELNFDQSKPARGDLVFFYDEGMGERIEIKITFDASNADKGGEQIAWSVLEELDDPAVSPRFSDSARFAAKAVVLRCLANVPRAKKTGETIVPDQMQKRDSKLPDVFVPDYQMMEARTQARDHVRSVKAGQVRRSPTNDSIEQTSGEKGVRGKLKIIEIDEAAIRKKLISKLSEREIAVAMSQIGAFNSRSGDFSSAFKKLTGYDDLARLKFKVGKQKIRILLRFVGNGRLEVEMVGYRQNFYDIVLKKD